MKTIWEVLPGNRYLATWILLKRANDILSKVRNRELRRYGINLEYQGTLYAIKRLGRNATPGEIARLRCRRPHTVSQVLKNMERDGLVTRNKDLGRKNMVRVALTEKGEKASPKLVKSVVIRKILSVLAREEMERFRTDIGMLRGEAERVFASHFKTMLPAPYASISEPELDFQCVLRRTDAILNEVSRVINGTEPEKLTSGNKKLGRTGLVGAALTAKCFSKDSLEQLSEYLEIIRNQTPPRSDARPSPRAYAPGELESALWRKIRRTHDIIIRIRDRELGNHGFSVKLASVLLAINTLGDKATASEIAKWRLRSASTMSSFLKRLESQGLVRRTTDTAKSQYSQLFLTEKGKQCLGFALQADSVIQIFSLFSPEELDRFGGYLERIRDRAVEEFKRLNVGPS